jgi:SNF2 family DNA or RNA helicase
MAISTISTKNKPRTIEKLLAVYKSEPVLHQKILQMKALLFFMERKGDFINGLSRGTLRGMDGKKFTSYNLNPILNRLHEKKLLTENFNCNPVILHEITTDAISQNNTEAAANLIELGHFFNYKQDYEVERTDSLNNIRIIHIATHLNNPHIFLNASNFKPDHCNVFIHNLIIVFYQYSLDPEWINSRHPVIQLYLLCAKLYGFHANVNPLPLDLKQWINFIRQNDCVELAIKHNLDKIPLVMSRILQLSLAFKKSSYLAEHLPYLLDQQYFQCEAKGAVAFFNEDKTNAIQHYEQASKLFKSLLDKHEWFRSNLHGVFYVLALLYQNASNDDLKKAAAAIASMRKIHMHEAIPCLLDALLHLKRNDRTGATSHYNSAQHSMSRSPTALPFLQALLDWVYILLEPEKLPQLIKRYQEKFRLYHDESHYFTAQLYVELIKLHNENDEEVQYFFSDLSPFGSFRFMNILHVKQPWEYAIDQLHNILTDKITSTNQLTSVSDRRMIWIVNPSSLHIEVAEQSLRKNGTWSAGRAIALKRLNYRDPKLDYLTHFDRAATAGLRSETHGWYNQEEFSWDTRQTLNALIGHPLIFHSQNRDIPLELTKGVVELQVEKTDSGYHFSLSKYSTTPRVFLEKETTNRYRVIDFSDETVSICKILSEKGMTVPFQAKDKVIDMICNAKSTIHIHSDVADDDLPIIAGDLTPCVHLFPINDGVKINLWIRPFGEQGPYCRASHGQRSIIATILTPDGEKRQKVTRDFDAEKNSIQSLIHHCTTLAEFDEKTDEWHFDAVENSLELLLELDEYKKNCPLIIEWPKGQTFKVKQTISSKNLALSIKGSQYWFEYEGEVKIDEEHALDIKKLLDLLGQSHGRFIPLGTGEFIALTEKFKKQLEDLRTLSDGNKVYHLSSGSLRGLAEEAGTLKEDKAWVAHLKKLTAMEKHKPIIPSTLQAELREYQVEGFFYLSRLAHWEIGACLADDMGLGKTIQAIALLLSHAPIGPCLVVAPTSVCFVWLEELAKFAPTLIPHTLYNAGDRTALIESLGKMDILICSYGLLHQAGDLLLDKSWQMVILDEAQAIKNADTKRWKYATQLNSKCRIALTGTPIENHLGELWSIFRFLNPGLLGSLASFQQRFSGPIEKYHDPVARRALKNLVSPYILRRTKSEVLLELPPKIEQSILIEPTPEEMAFYEAVRVKALERIHQLETSENHTKRFSILAEITRLRQACCHASLVDENMLIESSKIKTFITLVKNIIDNKHKALIFSQFVRYLDKIKEVLNQENIDYQYLDGSTSIKDRQRAVNDFQAGVGDLFLISLKAGGTGLNLTAADYVIILDPWWNPAVEDQAADRAHRMGQLRPVTVYRLIMKNSIEEKIITLHKNKKDLAADLLSGSDMSGKISEEDLVGLITG